MEQLTITVPATEQDVFLVHVDASEGKRPTPIAALCADIEEARTVRDSAALAPYSPKILQLRGQVGGDGPQDFTTMTFGLQVTLVGEVT